MIDESAGEKIVTPTVLFLFIWLTVVKIALDIVVYLGLNIVVVAGYFNPIYFSVVAIILFDAFRKPLHKKSSGRATCKINTYVDSNIHEGCIGGLDSACHDDSFLLVDDHTV